MAKRNRNTNAGKVNTGRTRVNVQAAESKTFAADGNPETSTDDIASAPQHRSADDEHGTRSDDERLSARSTEVATVNEGGSRSNPGSIRQEQDNTATSDSEGGLSRKPGFFRSGSERSSEFAARIARQRLDRSSTYHAPTQASIAKGRGKVQLPSGRSSRENLKGPPQQIVAPQGSASNLGDGRRWRQPGSEEEDFGDNTSNTDARNWSGSSTPDSYGSSGNDEAETTTQNPPSDLSSAQIRALERKLSKIGHELEEKREDLRDANEYMEKLRQETEKLTTIISRAYSGDQNSSPDFAALKSLLQASEFDTESSALKSALLQVTLRFENTIQSLASDKERIQQQLTDSESKLDIVLKSFEKKAQFADTSVPGAQSAWENDRDSFEGIYRDERRKRVYAEEQLKKLRETAEQWRQPDHANEELKANLDNTHAEIVKLQETLEKQQALAELWESECKTKQDELEKCTTGFENEASHQRTDMLANIQDYYDKVCDQEHWHPEGLQETIRKLEREKQVTIEDFETLKSEKRRTKEEISKLRKTLAHHEERIAQYEKAFITGGPAPTVQASDSDSHTSSTAHSSRSTSPTLVTPKKVAGHGPAIPRCHLPQEIERRKAIMGEFREAQSKRRKADELEAELMERVRAWKMQDLYPPNKKGWMDLKAKSSWVRWGGEQWLLTTEDVNDMKIAEGIRLKGLL